MRVSKICSKVTYHKCIRELNNYGYLRYEPSYNPFKGSLVYLFDFRTGSEQAVNRERIKNETSTEQALIPYINNTNNNKLQTKENEGAHTQKNQEEEIENLNDQKKKIPAKKKSDFIPPQLPEVREYFSQKSFPILEADKFYNHFASNGWLVSGKTPMKDWQAAANKWMLNDQKFNKPVKNSNLHASTGKDYSEAL
jgi:hypothetical protein